MLVLVSLLTVSVNRAPARRTAQERSWTMTKTTMRCVMQMRWKGVKTLQHAIIWQRQRIQVRAFMQRDAIIARAKMMVRAKSWTVM